MRHSSWCSFICLLVLLVSCKPSVPSDYIQPKELENILYDYHLAGEMSREVSNPRYSMQTYKAAILKKHGYTEAEFDQSMDYYMRHTAELHDIYERLAKRFSNEALAQGVSISDINKYGNISEKGDTADIWKAERSFVLTPYRACNMQSFRIVADTAFHAGDRMILNLNSLFLYQDGIRDAIMVLSVKFSNDSIASRMTHISTASHFSLQIDDTQRLGIKEVRGYVMLNGINNADNYSSTLHMLAVSGISLIRMHIKPAAVIPTEAVGPSTVDSLAPVDKQPEGIVRERPANIEPSPLPRTGGHMPMRTIQRKGDVVHDRR